MKDNKTNYWMLLLFTILASGVTHIVVSKSEMQSIGTTTMQKEVILGSRNIETREVEVGDSIINAPVNTIPKDKVVLDKDEDLLAEDNYTEDDSSQSRGYFGFVTDFDYSNGELHVFYVTENSPAEIAGLREGDKIVKINGSLVSDMEEGEPDYAIDSVDKLELDIIRLEDKQINIKIERGEVEANPAVNNLLSEPLEILPFGDKELIKDALNNGELLDRSDFGQ